MNKFKYIQTLNEDSQEFEYAINKLCEEAKTETWFSDFETFAFKATHKEIIRYLALKEMEARMNSHDGLFHEITTLLDYYAEEFDIALIETHSYLGNLKNISVMSYISLTEVVED